MDLPAADHGFTEGYETERAAQCHQGVIAVCVLAAVLLSGFAVVDSLLFPDRLSLLLKLRAAMVVPLLGILAFLRWRLPPRHALAAAIALALLLGLAVDVLILVTGGAASPYYAGNCLVLMGMAVLIPWRPMWSILSSLGVAGIYVAVVFMTPPVDRTMLTNALAFLLSTAIIGSVSSAIGERLRWREFENRTGLATALRHKSQFLANMSHDLRTPLNVIVGYVQLLVEGTFGPVGPEQREMLDRVLRSASHQLGLISDLLDLARIEQGKLSCELRDVRVADLVPFVREMMEPLLRDRTVVLEVDVAPEAVAWTDPERLRQVLANLLTNAAKFTEHGYVRFGATRLRDTVRLSVADTGPGMDPAIRERVLEPFVRGEGAAAGWGLGLAIVARLVQALDGTVEIDSHPGRGTTVDVSLPACRERSAA